MPITTIFFDLDDTLYPASSGLWGAIRSRIDLYMVERLHIPKEQVHDLRHYLFSTYGTTMRGLQATMHIDAQDYLDFVHDVPVADFITPNPDLRIMLSGLTQRKIIFTNADVKHAGRVLDRLQVSDCFDQIIDIQSVAPYCKPQVEAFLIALQLAGKGSASECALVDDGLSNLAAANKLGFFTVRAGSDELVPESHTSIGSITELPLVLAGFNNGDQPIS
jgi:putative hydrolase of the HAD superfamily